MQDRKLLPLSRRQLLTAAAALTFSMSAGVSVARTISGSLPWKPMSAEPPVPVDPRGWRFLTAKEVRVVEAIVDRLIPADDLSPGGKDAGCAIFIDRQLAGYFGDGSRYYTAGPYHTGSPTQGYQGSLTPAMFYRQALKAMDDYSNAHMGKKDFADLSPEDQDKMLSGMEKNKIDLKLGAAIPLPTSTFFNLVLANTMEGFFADPIYGGNKDMVSWKMIGFPGARYDYRDHIEKHNVPYPHGPVSIASGEASWTVKG